MTDYYRVEPEVAGSASVREDESGEAVLDYEFEGWLGDELVESVGHYVVTDALRDRIETADLSGYRLARATASRSPTFEDRHPDRTLPAVHWLVVEGLAGVDDFGIGERYDAAVDALVVSDRALAVIEAGQFDHADVHPWTGDRDRVEGGSRLKRAVVRGDPDAFEAALDRVTREGELDGDALHAAALLGEVEMAGALVEAGAPLDGRDHEGKTPLHLAIATGNDEVARLLVERGADPRAEDDHGNRPLWRAVFEGDVPTIELLVEHGADPDHVNAAGRSPRDLAEEYGVAEILDAIRGE